MNARRNRPTLRGLLGAGLVAIAFLAPAGARSQDGGLRLSPSLASADSPATSRAAPPTAGSYRVDTGDRVSVTVYGEPDLGVDGARVNDDGKIVLPLLGEVDVRGLDAQAIRDSVVTRLADGYLKKPNVSVTIDGYRLYYIKGEVTRPGGYSYLEGLTIEKAVALAGGYTVRASEKAITLVRESAPSERRQSVPPETPIRPGDVITVGESFF